jgi:Aerotolerance regulator N-terminal
MLDLGWLGLTNPWLLVALLSLPALWWLLRVIPPAPRRLRFPTIRFLLGLQPEEETSARTPPWLLALRLLLATLLILALAGPVLNPEPELEGDGPLVLAVDDGWAAAPRWDQRLAALERFTDRAQRQQREVILLGTARDPAGAQLRRLSAADAVRGIAGWLPKPWPVDRDAALARLEAETIADAEVIWLSDGIAEGPEARASAARFGQGLQRLGALRVFADPAAERAILQRRPEVDEDALVANLRRPARGPSATVAVRALGPRGEVLARAEATFEAQALAAQARIELPLELRNRIARLETQPPMAVGGVVLLDERWRRRVIGLGGESAAQAPQPLLSELYYVERARAPHAALRRGSVEDLLAGELSGMVLPDSAQLSPEVRVQLGEWIEAGGVLLRFAGPRLANAEHDDLVPVPLRRGDRNLDGTLSWARPLALTSFDAAAPLAGLQVPEGDVVVHRQVLAQPGPGLAAASWARLADGTPLITGARRGEGWLILVHTTANTTWSSLPLSGVFVDLMQRFAGLGHGAGGALQGTLAPIEVLDAAGHLGPPGAAVQPLPAAEFAAAVVSAEHPPGLYGRIDAGEGAARQALNLASAVPELTALEAADFPVAAQDFVGSAEVDLMPWILLAALLLALADTVIGLVLRGLAPDTAGAGRGGRAAAVPPAVRGGAGPGRSDPQRHLRDQAGLRHDRARRGRRAQPRRARRTEPGAPASHRGRGRRAARDQPRGRRSEPLSAAVLAGARRPSRAAARRARADRGLSEPGRHDPVRHRRRRRDDPGPGRAGPGRAAAAPAARRREPAAAPAGAGGPYADALVLPAAGVPGPLDRADHLGRPGRRERQRRRLVGDHRRPRLGRRLGGRRVRPDPAAGAARRRAAARDGAPFRRQPRDVRADRQLQDRPGACAGAARAAGPMTGGASLSFVPLLPWPLLAALAVAIVAVVGFGFWRRARGMIWRAAMLALGLLALVNPVVVREERQPLEDTAVLLVDRSPSQEIGDRPAQIDQAVRELRESLDGLEALEVVEATVRGDGQGGTLLFEELADTLAEIDRSRLAGVLIVSDGQVHDVPPDLAGLGIDAPLHLLLTGNRDEQDRRLLVEEVPSYGMVGDRHEITLRVDHLPGRSSSEPVTVTLRQNGEVRQEVAVQPGAPRTLPFELNRAGKTVLEIEAAALPGELTTRNNRQVFFVNGVRDRLRVLLVSGQPYPGLRVWRNLLKADPAVDLVHFTILRPPEKQDGTPIRELALIAFPSRELFEVKLGEFDLVIFDRYSRRGLLPLAYLDNVARYVEEGGALLEVAGPEFAHPLSLYRTPLARVLPARPSGVVYEQGFTPTLTELGRRHPVTEDLRADPDSDEADGPAWGRWFRQIDVEVNGSQVLMSGAGERPLLVLDRIGEGRVAQLLSDQQWLWARGVEGGGPQGLLLRRLVHWLMQEPELEEEALRAEPQGDAVAIERRSLEELSERVTVTTPSGRVEEVALEPAGEGVGRALIDAAEAGLYRVSDGELTDFAAARPIGAQELADMRASPEPLTPLVEASGGAITWLADRGTPALRKVAPGRALAGRDWIGIHRTDRYLVTGATQQPLLPALLALLLLLGTLGFAWYREGR